MKTRTSLRLLFISFFLINSAFTQDLNFERKISPFPVLREDGSQITFPFLGGFNTPKVQFADINGDGFPDLFIQEEIGTINQPGKLIFFENSANPGVVDFIWRTDWYLEIDIGNWFKFVDFDDDGDLDLFTESRFSLIKYYDNTGTAQSPNFMLQADSLRNIQGELISFDSGSLPEIVDIDCDGDLDLLIGRNGQGTISLYENNGFLLGGVPQFERVPGNFQNISIIGELGGNKALTANHNKLHGTHGLSILDIDGDGDPDIFWGDQFEPGLVFLENTGSCQSPDIDITTRRYPPSAPLETGGFNIPRFSDIDRDGDFDLFVSVLGGAFSMTTSLIENFYFYENIASGAEPEFQLRTKRFISTLDAGSFSALSFADIDADGDQDLFIGNYLNPVRMEQGEFSQIYFYENTGSPHTPQFRLSTKNFAELEIGTDYRPAFVDIDNDLDPDLFVGEAAGTLNFLENTGTPQAPQFAEVVENYAGIDVGRFSSPAFFDYDNDGDFDLFIGGFDGQIEFWENTGSPQSPQFVLQTDAFLGIDVGQHSSPAFSDMDGDGDADLIIGSQDRGIFLYQNTGSSGTANFVLDENAFGFRVKNRATPAVTDIDADGDQDFFTGAEYGGILYFENRKYITEVESGEFLPETFSLDPNYPNPFNPQTFISYHLAEASFIDLTIYNLSGQLVKKLVAERQNAGQYTVSWNGKSSRGLELPSGIYFYKLSAGAFTQTRRMILLK